MRSAANGLARRRSASVLRALLPSPAVRVPTDTIAAPMFPAALKWLNVATLRMDKQRGRPVLLEFWDFCDPASLRTLPYLDAWDERYGDAGLRTILVQAPGFYEKLTAQTARLAQGLSQAAREANVPFIADSVGGMFGLYFADKVPGSFAEVTKSDVTRFNRFFHQMLDAGVYFAPSAYEAGFVSSAI